MKLRILIVLLFSPAWSMAQDVRNESDMAEKSKLSVISEVSKLPAAKMQRSRIADSLQAIADSLMTKSVRTHQDTVRYVELRRDYLRQRKEMLATAQLDSLGIMAQRISVGREHPEWVHLDFPYSTSTGRKYRLVCQSMRDLLSLGAEPSYADSIVAESQYVRRLIPGRLIVNSGVVQSYMNRMKVEGISPVAIYSDTTSNINVKWRRFLKLCITDGRY